MPKAICSRNQHFSRHSAVGKRGCPCLVLQQKTKREKNDASGGPSPEYGGRIFPSRDPSSTPHTTESCAVTIFMNNPSISVEEKNGKGTLEFTVFKFGLFSPFCFPERERERKKRHGKVEQFSFAFLVFWRNPTE